MFLCKRKWGPWVAASVCQRVSVSKCLCVKGFVCKSFCLCVRGSVCKSVCVQKGVCVYHLNRCKTSHWLFTNLQRDVAYNQGPRPTKLPDCMGYRA